MRERERERERESKISLSPSLLGHRYPFSLDHLAWGPHMLTPNRGWDIIDLQLGPHAAYLALVPSCQ